MRAAFNRKVVFQEEIRDNQSTFCTLYKYIKHTLIEEPPFDVSAVRGGSSAEVDTVGLEAIHPLSSSPPAPSSLSLLLQKTIDERKNKQKDVHPTTFVLTTNEIKR
ncbi:conserved hypothetical protein [Trichinella spiralis]|uniref:hypothetical protein n=1 Tax=Trichinella spiralis TaxID=6334 RepID=UPI0001EFD29E|nr:conserved hypothetical protein [Trichinella spiralis]